MRALIIDDDPIALELLEGGLKACGFTETIQASNGEQAVAAFESNKARLDLVVCDLHMPEFDGVEFIQYLSGEKSQCPFIILSSASDVIVRSANTLADAGNLKVLGTLRKPLVFSQLAKLTRQIRESQSARSPIALWT